MTVKTRSGVSKADVINTILESGVLGSSKNQISLFKYLLDAKYDNRIESIKTQDIAARVFSRDGAFKTKSDSIVRVEMFRLRNNLDSFNQQSETLKLILPKSSYDLEIKSIAVPMDAADKSRKLFNIWPQGVMAVTALATSVFFLTVAFDSNKKPSDCSVQIPNLEIVHKPNKSDLEEFVEDVVRGAASQYSHFNIVDDVKTCHYTGVPGYILRPSIFQTNQTFRGSISILSQSNGEMSATQNFFGTFDNTGQASDDFDDELFVNLVKITNDLLKPVGPVHRDAIEEKWRNRAVFKDYNCIAVMNDSYVSDSDKAYNEALSCLQQAYQSETPLLDNMGGLAASYLEQAQGIRLATVADPIVQAKEILDEVGEQWPLSVEATIAKIMYESQRDDYNTQSLRETLFRAEKSYGTNPVILGDIAKYSGYILGDWEMAQRLVVQARALTSDRANSLYFVDAAYVLIQDVPADEAEICLKAFSEYSKVANLIVNACAKKYKMPIWYERTNVNLRKLELGSLNKKEEFMKSLRFEMGLAKKILQ